MSTAVNTGAQINFGDLTIYLTYGLSCSVDISFKDDLTVILLFAFPWLQEYSTQHRRLHSIGKQAMDRIPQETYK
jgi:hypothetical protein